MKRTNYAMDHGDHCTITVDASPGANRTEIIGANPWRSALQVRIAAKAKDGEANAELVRFLAERLSVPGSSVRVVKGMKGSLKVVRLPVSAARAYEILGGD